ncbi:MAG: response regulator transcription factor [Dehalococcoidia bacterium]|nr:response regulator transcription factor [Dehalococcoidia bacterium]
MATVLLIDASEEVQPVAAALAGGGYHVAHAALADVLHEPSEETPAVLLLNLLARPDASAVRNLLRSPDLPHGVASVALVRLDDLATLDLGAGFDDFIVHPAAAEEVLARVRRAIRVKSGLESDNTLRADDLHIDLANYKVYVAGRPVDLTYKEYELLRFLATNREKVFTREALLNRVWGYDFYGGARTVDVHIRRLRSKIEDRTHTFIETVRNVGYRFRVGE